MKHFIKTLILLTVAALTPHCAGHGSALDCGRLKPSETWVANERVFTAAASYTDPFNAVSLDFVLTNTENGAV